MGGAWALMVAVDSARIARANFIRASLAEGRRVVGVGTAHN
jgi:hypothetical protein